MPAIPDVLFQILNKCNMSLCRKVKACVVVKEENDVKVMGTHDNAYCQCHSAYFLVRITAGACPTVPVSFNIIS